MTAMQAGRRKQAEQAALWEQYRQTRSVADRNELAKSNLGLVYAAANRLVRYAQRFGLERDDLVSLGAEGLLQAIERFRPDGGAAFGTFAARFVRWAIHSGLQAHRRRDRMTTFTDAAPPDGEARDAQVEDIREERPEFDPTMREQMERLIARLSALDVRVIRLFYLDRLPSAEVAERIGTTRGYARALTQQAMRRLRGLGWPSQRPEASRAVAAALGRAILRRSDADGPQRVNPRWDGERNE